MLAATLTVISSAEGKRVTKKPSAPLCQVPGGDECWTFSVLLIFAFTLCLGASRWPRLGAAGLAVSVHLCPCLNEPLPTRRTPQRAPCGLGFSLQWCAHRCPLLPQLSEAQKACEGARRSAQQLKRKSKQLTGDLEDTRVLMESQQSRNHELEKRQKK